VTRLRRDPDLLARYATDVSSLRAEPDAVLLPRDEQDISEAIKEAAGQGVPVLPVGGRTSTTGASVPVGGGIVIDMSRLAPAIEIDAERSRAVVGPGAILADVRAAARRGGLDLPVDPTSEHDCTVGGAVATNASGPSTFRHGPMNARVAALELVDGTGTRRSLRRRAVSKCAMGPAALQDPVGMIVGSEGLFGVITAIELTLIPAPAARASAFVGFERRPALFAAVGALGDRRRPLGIRGIEWLDGTCCDLLRPRAGPMPLPEGPAGGVLIDVVGADEADVLTNIERAMAICAEQGARTADATLFADVAARRRFAELRHRVPDTLNRHGRALHGSGGGKISTDWSVPLSALEELLVWSEQALAATNTNSLFIFGHIGDGHPHLNLLVRDAEHRAAVSEVLAEQLRRVVAAGGSPVSEHGIGKLKRELVRPYLPPASVAAIRALKSLWDPQDVMAPGNIVGR